MCMCVCVCVCVRVCACSSAKAYVHAVDVSSMSFLYTCIHHSLSDECFELYSRRPQYNCYTPVILYMGSRQRKAYYKNFQEGASKSTRAIKMYA